MDVVSAEVAEITWTANPSPEMAGSDSGGTRTVQV